MKKDNTNTLTGGFLGWLLIVMLFILGSTAQWGSDVIFTSGVVQSGTASQAGTVIIADGTNHYATWSQSALSADWAPKFPGPPAGDGYLYALDIDGTASMVDPATVGPAGLVDTSGTPVLNDFAKFTDLDTIEGRSYTETKTDLSLNNVENTALTTWAGTTNIITLGTITSGIWTGTDVAVADGGTGAGDAGTARSNLGAAASGANSDITGMSGLTGDVGDGIDKVILDEATAAISPAAGKFEWYSESVMLAPYVSHEDSGARWISGTLFANYGGIDTVTNTASETSLTDGLTGRGNLTLPTYFFGDSSGGARAGSTIRVTARGNYISNGETFIMRLKLGSTVVGLSDTSVALTVPADLRWEFEADVTSWTVGTTGTVDCNGRFAVQIDAATWLFYDVKNSGGITTVTTINTHTTQLIGLTLQNDAADVLTSTSVREFIVEVLN